MWGLTVAFVNQPVDNGERGHGEVMAQLPGRDRPAAPAAEHLDAAFAALADPVRRTIVARLSTSSATVNELAALFPISKQAVSKHIAVLEAAGLITRSRDAQRRPCHLQPVALERLTGWLDGHRLAAEAQYRRLDALLDTLAVDTDPETHKENPS